MSRESKFDFEYFYGDDGRYLAVNARKYSLEEATEIFKEEMQSKEAPPIKSGTVFYGFGVDDDGEHQNAWWLDLTVSHAKRHCPVYVFEL